MKHLVKGLILAICLSLSLASVPITRSGEDPVEDCVVHGYLSKPIQPYANGGYDSSFHTYWRGYVFGRDTGKKVNCSSNGFYKITFKSHEEHTVSASVMWLGRPSREYRSDYYPLYSYTGYNRIDMRCYR